jgi:hypothetical protein
MGEVWKARDTRVDRTVALKFAQAGFTERFERESRAIAALNHPNICHLYDVGPNYLVMEYVDGEPLRPPGDWRTLLDAASAIAGGLAAAHASGIVHRDLKPDNILVRRDGVIKILDFGLAKRAADNVFVTRTTPVTAVGGIVGTVAYMSPEQATGRELDVRSDQFSFGLILYELACGKRPFDRPSSAETMASIIRDEPEPLAPDVPRPLTWIIERCLAKDPALRYDSTRDLYRELSTVRQHLSEVTRTAPSLPARPARRRRWLRDAVLALVGVVLGGAGVALWRSSSAPADPVWSGTRLGGASISLNPRISPDGHLLAFIAFVNGVTELAVMEPGSASWTLLTHAGREGYVQNMSWSRDGSKLYFDRYWGQPAGIYAIPPLGGAPTLLLDKAFEPQALPDGSLLVARLSGSSYQIVRFWPSDGRLQPLQAFLDLADVAVPFSAFADGRQVAYFGRPSVDPRQPNALRVLNLETGATRTLDPNADITARSLLSLPLAVTPEGAAVITLARRGDTYDLIQVRTDGTPGHRVLMTLRPTELPWYVEAAADGSVYLDQLGRPHSIVEFSAARNTLEQSPGPAFDTSAILPVGAGRTFVVGASGSKPRVLIGMPGSEFQPLLLSDEESGGPLAPAGKDAFAAILGSNERRRIVLASIADGHILREIPLSSAAPTGLAVSPDRTSVYYAQNGSVYALTGSAPARRLGEGNTIVLDPAGRFLYAKQFAHDPIRLVRIDVATGEEAVIKLPSEPRLTQVSMSAVAMDASQHLLVDTTSPLGWFYRAAVLDVRSGEMTMIPMSFVGDCVAPGWGQGGTVFCDAVGLTGSLWRYQRARPEKSQ